LVALIVQVPPDEYDNTLPDSEHDAEPAATREKVTAPVPVPPDVDKLVEEPSTADVIANDNAA
jgi:hypothetical protein